MQKLFYVVCRWLQEDQSKQSQKLCNNIKEEMENIGFNYEAISNTERQREELYHEREKLIREKQKLEEQKRQIEHEREQNIKLIQEKERLEQERTHLQERLIDEHEEESHLRSENEELEGQRQLMVNEYERLQQERNKIIEERQLLFDRMQKIEKLQKLQKMYQDELRRLREEAGEQAGNGLETEEQFEEHKDQEEEANEMPLQIPEQSQEPLHQAVSYRGKEHSTLQQRQQGSQYEDPPNSIEIEEKPERPLYYRQSKKQSQEQHSKVASNTTSKREAATQSTGNRSRSYQFYFKRNQDNSTERKDSEKEGSDSFSTEQKEQKQ